MEAGWWKHNRKTRILLAALRCADCGFWHGVELPVSHDGTVQLRSFRETRTLASDHLGFKGAAGWLLVAVFWAVGRALVYVRARF